MLALLISAARAADVEPPVRELDAASMQKLVASNDKVVLLMFAEGCKRAESFAPTLERIALEVTGLVYGNISVGEGSSSGLATRFRIEKGAPSLRALFRNAPPAQRMLDYAGPPTFEAVLEWCKAVHAWDGSSAPPTGWNVGKRDEQEPTPAAEQKEAKKKREHTAKPQHESERTVKDEV